MIKNTPIRILLVFGALSLSGILFTQIYWVSKAIRNEEQQFSHSVQMAMRNVVESLCEVNGVDFDHDPIDQVANNYFIARASNKINLSSLDYHLKAEFEKRNLKQDFEFGVYDCQTDRMVYGDFISFGNEKIKPMGKLPKLDQDEYYFGVYFPAKEAGFGGSLGIWKFTSFLTLVIVIFFGYALFVILKQKRLGEVQRDFINNMTHELKTPLATLKLSADVLKQESTSARAQKYAQIVEEEANRLQVQISRVLDQTLLDQVNRKKNTEEIDICKLIEALKNRFSTVPATWELNLGESLFIKSDRDLLEKVLFNLLENALKYGNGWVKVETKKYGKALEISISNKGEPIPRSDHKKIFEQFYRVPKGDLHDVKGYGLGLYFVKKSLSKLNGKIKVESNTQLTTFTLKLPLHR